MAKKASSAAKVRTPLNTQDVTRVAGVTRRVLDRYEQTGLLVPRRMEATAKAKKQWSIEQAKFAEYVRILQHGDRSLEEIAKLADRGIEAFFDVNGAQCAQDMREARRQFKAGVKDCRRCEGSRRVGERDGLYLRMFPQRWLALAPIPNATEALPDPNACAALYVELYSVSHVVGWCPTGSTGVLVSTSGQLGGSVCAYAFVELASPPMPASCTGQMLDGGCYRSIAAGEEVPDCDGSCELCSHFGRKPTTEERFRWNARELDFPVLRTHAPLAGDASGSYSYGIWSDTPADEHDLRSVNAFRPRLMPHSVRLPLGITACSMPEGAYLCDQCAEDEETQTYQRLVGTMLAMPHREFTDDDELRLVNYRAGQDARAPRHNPGKPFQPLVPSAGITDLDRRSAVIDVGYEQLARLVVPTRMGLPPQTGFCVSYSIMPADDRNNVPKVELRALVDASAFASDDFASAADLALWV